MPKDSEVKEDSMSKLTAEQIEQFTRDGYLKVKSLFDREETDLLLNIAKGDQQIEQQAQERLDLSSGTKQVMDYRIVG